MYRDVTELPETVNCITIINDKALRVFTDSSTDTYQLISNKYYATDTFEPNTPRPQDVCYTLQEIQTLPSTYDFIVPIYHTIAIVSAIAIFYIAYKLILYPFFRKKI